MPKAPPSSYANFLIDGTTYRGTYGEAVDQQTAPSDESRPDPTWSHLDRLEHFHAFDSKSGEAPTMLTRSRDVPCNGACGQAECDGFSETNYFCRICDELIRPRFIKSTREVVVATVHSWGARVFGPIIVPGVRVTVKIDKDDYAPRFGLATVSEVAYGSNADAELELHGIGRLGFMPLPS